jgi:hypothetical protein
MCQKRTDRETPEFFGGGHGYTGIQVHYFEKKDKNKKIGPVSNKGFGVDNTLFTQETPAKYFDAKETPPNREHNSHHVRDDKCGCGKG